MQLEKESKILHLFNFEEKPQEQEKKKKKNSTVTTIILPVREMNSFIKGKTVNMLDYYTIARDLKYKVLLDTDVHSGYYSTIRKTIHLPTVDAVTEFFKCKGYGTVTPGMIDAYQERALLKALLCIITTRFNGGQILIRYPKKLGKAGSLQVWFSGRLTVKSEEDLNDDINIQRLLMS